MFYLWRKLNCYQKAIHFHHYFLEPRLSFKASLKKKFLKLNILLVLIQTQECPLQPEELNIAQLTQ
ncbi:hypothetical protein EGH44_23665 [Klebsiella aerogenes]|nr:hypothetical protein EGH44_23665 [Klebsiella aerogenes]